METNPLQELKGISQVRHVVFSLYIGLFSPFPSGY